jgi:hypothetical protein
MWAFVLDGLGQKITVYCSKKHRIFYRIWHFAMPIAWRKNTWFDFLALASKNKSSGTMRGSVTHFLSTFFTYFLKGVFHGSFSWQTSPRF